MGVRLRGMVNIVGTFLENIKIQSLVMPCSVALLVVFGFRRALHDRQARKQLELDSSEAKQRFAAEAKDRQDVKAALDAARTKDLELHEEKAKASKDARKEAIATGKEAIATKQENHKAAMAKLEQNHKDAMAKSDENHKEAMQASEKLLNAHVVSSDKLVKAHVDSSGKLLAVHESQAASLKEVSDAKLAVAKQNTEANIASAAHNAQACQAMGSMVSQINSLMAAVQESRSERGLRNNRELRVGATLARN